MSLIDEQLDLNDPKLHGIIIVREFEDGTIDWFSSYEDLDDFFEVLNIVAEEASEPEVEVNYIH
jgi:hypothetical protein